MQNHGSPISPNTLKKHYDIDENYNGNGITVGIVGAFTYDDLQKDFDIFSDKNSLPITKIEVYKNYTDSYIRNSVKRRWNLESALCVQWLHAFAPMTRICFFASGSDEFESIFKTIELAGKVCDIVSLSFGIKEFSKAEKYESYFEKSKCFFVCAAGNDNFISYPASSRYVLSVGGTEIDFFDSEDHGAETVFSKSGCGLSQHIKIPEHQANSGFGIRILTAYRRAVPDLSFFASGKRGVSVIFEQNEKSCFGTSIGAPCVSGICACIAQKNKQLLAKKASFFYELAEKVGYDEVFFDITKGNSGDYYAHSGFDLCTGLGSPKVKSIIKYCRTPF